MCDLLRVAGSERNGSRQGFDGSEVVVSSEGADTKSLLDVLVAWVGMFR